jgi:hypothetical protein
LSGKCCTLLASFATSSIHHIYSHDSEEEEEEKKVQIGRASLKRFTYEWKQTLNLTISIKRMKP